ncbi:hypothetical protein PPERSA_06500 [Pseudocohnilembus persalinus]|uniref:Uncharacterized protein n=1 Tax=Pseudocohnilembus persalinus TaxID=266149 RepID=A0A0V0QRC7_PSEPJ|nr:hypothetical protein PPERSA_06500 [Pseudocohnilembus persalinus]|eukprot:KRX04866.1 hypothetical protein PPERSA_06500 [Pseudocohnilembus persalinus]
MSMQNLAPQDQENMQNILNYFQQFMESMFNKQFTENQKIQMEWTYFKTMINKFPLEHSKIQPYLENMKNYNLKSKDTQQSTTSTSASDLQTKDSQQKNQQKKSNIPPLPQNSNGNQQNSLLNLNTVQHQNNQTSNNNIHSQGSIQKNSQTAGYAGNNNSSLNPSPQNLDNKYRENYVNNSNINSGNKNLSQNLNTQPSQAQITQNSQLNNNDNTINKSNSNNYLQSKMSNYLNTQESQSSNIGINNMKVMKPMSSFGTKTSGLTQKNCSEKDLNQKNTNNNINNFNVQNLDNISQSQQNLQQEINQQQNCSSKTQQQDIHNMPNRRNTYLDQRPSYYGSNKQIINSNSNQNLPYGNSNSKNYSGVQTFQFNQITEKETSQQKITYDKKKIQLATQKIVDYFDINNKYLINLINDTSEASANTNLITNKNTVQSYQNSQKKPFNQFISQKENFLSPENNKQTYTTTLTSNSKNPYIKQINLDLNQKNTHNLPLQYNQRKNQSMSTQKPNQNQNNMTNNNNNYNNLQSVGSTYQKNTYNRSFYQKPFAVSQNSASQNVHANNNNNQVITSNYNSENLGANQQQNQALNCNQKQNDQNNDQFQLRYTGNLNLQEEFHNACNNGVKRQRTESLQPSRQPSSKALNINNIIKNIDSDYNKNCIKQRTTEIYYNNYGNNTLDFQQKDKNLGNGVKTELNEKNNRQIISSYQKYDGGIKNYENKNGSVLGNIGSFYEPNNNINYNNNYNNTNNQYHNGDSYMNQTPGSQNKLISAKMM